MDHELKLQKKTRDAVIEAGGRSMIISHRFLIGVPDLLAKVPGQIRMGIFEAKQCEKPVKAALVRLDVTPKQAMSLRDWTAADVPCGVISFLRHGKELEACIIGGPGFIWKPMQDVHVSVDAHFPIDAQCHGVVQLIEVFIALWEIGENG